MQDPRGQDVPTMVSDTIDLCHSPDDEERDGKGYYFQRYPRAGQQVDWSTFQDISQSFATATEAERAYRTHSLEWGR